MASTHLDVLSTDRRSPLEILIDLLEAAREHTRNRRQLSGQNPVSKREIMRATNLNYDQLTKYLGELEDRGFVVINEDDPGFDLIITARGEALLTQTEEIMELIEH